MSIKYVFDLDGVLRDIVPGFMLALRMEGVMNPKREMFKHYGKIAGFRMSAYELYRRHPKAVNNAAVPYRKVLEKVYELRRVSIILTNAGEDPGVIVCVSEWLDRKLPGVTYRICCSDLEKILIQADCARKGAYLYEDNPNIIKALLSAAPTLGMSPKIFMPLYDYNEHVRQSVTMYYHPEDLLLP